MALVAEVKDSVAAGFASFPEAVRVCMSRNPQADGAVHVQVAVRDPSDRDVRLRIYQKEQEIIREFERLDFDFEIVSSQEAPDTSMDLTFSRS